MISKQNDQYPTFGNTEMHRIKRGAVNQFQRILDKIESGEYRHDQQHFHCGTAHCIFGWKAVEDVAKSYKMPPADLSATATCENKRLINKAVKLNIPLFGDDIYKYVVNSWGLTDSEGQRIVAGLRTLPELREVLERFKLGQRLVYGDWCQSTPRKMLRNAVKMEAKENAV